LQLDLSLELGNLRFQSSLQSGQTIALRPGSLLFGVNVLGEQLLLQRQDFQLIGVATVLSRCNAGEEEP
jgi:hypothetical protein